MLLPDSLFDKFGKVFEPGQIIFCEYEPGYDFYFIQDGQVKITKTIGNSQKTLDVISKGDILGEMAILEQEPRSATAIAVDRVKSLQFNRDNFETLINGHPQLAFKLLVIFAKRIYDAKRRLQILLLDDLQSKIADVFLMLAEKDPNYGNLQQMIFNVTIDDVANWCGQPVQEVQKTLANFAKQGKLEIYANRIVVSNINDFTRLIAAKKKQNW
jgi:CRP-like cAMP-binding protein